MENEKTNETEKDRTSVKRKLSQLLATLSDDNEAKLSTNFARTIEKQLPHSFKMLKTKMANSRNLPKPQSEQTPTPTYRPWSLEDFLQRLQSYKLSNWSIPEELTKINAPECSRYGWVASTPITTTTKNFLRCCSCSKILNIQLGDDAELYEALEERYHKLLVEGHSNNCPWREKACSEALYDVPKKDYTKDVIARFNTLKDLELSSLSALQQHESDLKNKLDILARALNLLNDEEENEKEAKYNQQALLLAIQGWKHLHANFGICTLCFTKVDLTKDVPLSYHKSYCPYMKNDHWLDVFDYTSSRRKSDAGSANSDDDRDAEYKQRLLRLKQIYFTK